jgi:hypothetical protein
MVVGLEIKARVSFMEKYRVALIHSAELCKARKYLEKLPKFGVRPKVA